MDKHCNYYDPEFCYRNEETIELYNITMEDLVSEVRYLLKPTKIKYNDMSSYTLKHLFENILDGYVSNAAMKKALTIAGFRHRNSNEINWNFNISKKSLSNALKYEFELEKARRHIL